MHIANRRGIWIYMIYFSVSFIPMCYAIDFLQRLPSTGVVIIKMARNLISVYFIWIDTIWFKKNKCNTRLCKSIFYYALELWYGGHHSCLPLMHIKQKSFYSLGSDFTIYFLMYTIGNEYFQIVMFIFK